VVVVAAGVEAAANGEDVDGAATLPNGDAAAAVVEGVDPNDGAAAAPNKPALVLLTAAAPKLGAVAAGAAAVDTDAAVAGPSSGSGDLRLAARPPNPNESAVCLSAVAAAVAVASRANGAASFFSEASFVCSAACACSVAAGAGGDTDMDAGGEGSVGSAEGGVLAAVDAAALIAGNGDTTGLGFAAAGCGLLLSVVGAVVAPNDGKEKVEVGDADALLALLLPPKDGNEKPEGAGLSAAASFVSVFGVAGDASSAFFSFSAFAFA